MPDRAPRLSGSRYVLPAVDAAPIRVLILDEDRDVARTLARTVERIEGVEAVLATSPAEALEMAQELPFDVALVDLGREAKGVDLLLAIREASPETARVLLSAWPDESVAVGGAVFCQAHAYVLKPWDTAVLIKTLAKLIAPRAVRVASGAGLN